jgi:dTDP-glucose pyrophosphorylase
MSQRLVDISIREDSSIRDAMQAIDRGACWIALVIADGGRLLGLITDGDVRRALLAGASLSDPVGPYVQRKYTTVPPTAGRSEVLDIMRARTINQIPIVDEAGRLVGLHLLREIVGAVERPNWAVIMAGGRGERLRPLTDNLPKPMIKVAGRPILERLVLHLVGFGIRRVFISVNYLSHVIEEYFGDGSDYGCSIEYLREAQPLGTGGALSLLPALSENPLLVLNGDLVTEVDVGRLIAFHVQGSYVATLCKHEYVQSIPYGVLDVEDGRLRGIREKPTIVYPTNAGIYVLNPDVVRRVPQQMTCTVPMLVEDCLARQESVGVFCIEADWADVGRPRELKRARGEEGGL